VREDPLWARIALLLNLAGTILLALSFQATSSDFRLVTALGYDLNGKVATGVTAYALCVNDYTLLVTDSARGVGIGHKGCPNWESSRPSAVVTSEHPLFLYLGLGCSAIGFFMQLLIIPRRKTLAEINEQIRILRKTKRQMEMSRINQT
jgi:hypothetical protein